ncbi:methyltransferase [Gallaecimonas kandeliae]|uniref:tRNA1(Val) (adenine(37)-N6)-methyltransferase n=1 Tax=Gallaecimonas kandeliae TaxID=3029055 RepID=UPI002649217F|nr:methyltransferase [Gallaecimonas kandeliae]WKE66372.1 methyltransferase [Gallaecimonas kandeliae]
MSKGFQFKQFFVGHQGCAMKVGTDGVVLGLWAALPGRGRVLDLGTGTGLIALMLAQRGPDLAVQALELDAAALAQARQNLAASPFSDRIQLQGGDACHFDGGPFELVVSNPPFFTPDVHSPDPRRHQARHVAALPPEELAAACARVQAREVALVLPWEGQQLWAEPLEALGYRLYRRCALYSVAGKPSPVRALLQWSKEPKPFEESQLVLRDQDGQWTAQFRALGRDFYLHF